MKNNKYITVLDQEIGRIFQYRVEYSSLSTNKRQNRITNHEWCEDFLIEKGHNLGNIEWMLHDDNRVIVQTPHGEMKQLQSHYDIENQ